jgi:8-oxo-dGTP pyrophosphatase MutT (NUDIX family)
MKPKRQRATAMVEWSYQGQTGLLIHADRDGTWLLPGGGIEPGELPYLLSPASYARRPGSAPTPRCCSSITRVWPTGITSS